MSPSRRIPKYRKHSSRDKGFVEFDGQRTYLDGAYNSIESREHYDRTISEWLASRPAKAAATMTVGQIALLWQDWAKDYYPAHSQYHGCVATVKILRKLFGELPACEFGPKALRKFQDWMVENGYSRKYVNDTTARVKRLYRWAVMEEYVGPLDYQRLTVVPGLHKRRSKAKETAPIMPVDDSLVEATLVHLPAVIRDMVKLQRLTGANHLKSV